MQMIPLRFTTRMRLAGLVLFGATLMTVPSIAGDMPMFEILIKDHKFEPAEVVIPANTKVKLLVKNLDPTPEEFESFDFNREKIIAGGGQAVIFVGPLEPGRYNFFGEFNMETAQGTLVVE